MLKSLLRLWHRLTAWITQRPAVPAFHAPASEPYHPSNLHARGR